MEGWVWFGLVLVPLRCDLVDGGIEASEGGREGELTTRKYKHRIRQLDDWKISQVPHVDRMARYTDSGEEEGEAVDEGEEGLDGYYGVDEAGEKFAREYGVLFD